MQIIESKCYADNFPGISKTACIKALKVLDKRWGSELNIAFYLTNIKLNKNNFTVFDDATLQVLDF